MPSHRVLQMERVILLGPVAWMLAPACNGATLQRTMSARARQALLWALLLVSSAVLADARSLQNDCSRQGYTYYCHKDSPGRDIGSRWNNIDLDCSLQECSNDVQCAAINYDGAGNSWHKQYVSWPLVDAYDGIPAATCPGLYVKDTQAQSNTPYPCPTLPGLPDAPEPAAVNSPSPPAPRGPSTPSPPAAGQTTININSTSTSTNNNSNNSSITSNININIPISIPHGSASVLQPSSIVSLTAGLALAALAWWCVLV